MASSVKNSQQFSVQWDKCQANLLSSFEKLLNSELFVDVTLAVESEIIKCHKVVLSASSAYFEKILVNNPCPHPVIIMRDMKYWEVSALLNFMYKGEVSVKEENLELFLKAAEALQIRGLAINSTADGPNKLSESLDVKDESTDVNDANVCEKQSGIVESEQLSDRLSDVTNIKTSAKLKKAYYRNSLPSFKNSNNSATASVGVVSDTPLANTSPPENVIIKEEIDMDFVNMDEVSADPLEYGVLQGEEVSLEGTLSQIEPSDPGPSSSFASQSKEKAAIIEPGTTRELIEMERKEKLTVNDDQNKRRKHYCIFCKKVIFNLPRHLLSLHANKERVQEFCHLSSKDPKRTSLISKIRREGITEMNLFRQKVGKDIVPIRKGAKAIYVPCRYCGAYYSENTIYVHYRTCSGEGTSKGKLRSGK